MWLILVTTTSPSHAPGPGRTVVHWHRGTGPSSWDSSTRTVGFGRTVEEAASETSFQDVLQEKNGGDGEPQWVKRGSTPLVKSAGTPCNTPSSAVHLRGTLCHTVHVLKGRWKRRTPEHCDPHFRASRQCGYLLSPLMVLGIEPRTLIWNYILSNNLS